MINLVSMRGMTTAPRRSLVGLVIRGDALLATFGSGPGAVTAGDGADGWLWCLSAFSVSVVRVLGPAAGGAGAGSEAVRDVDARSVLRCCGSAAGPLANSFGSGLGTGSDGVGCDGAAATAGGCEGETIDAAGAGALSGAREATTESGVAGVAGVCGATGGVAAGATAATVAGARNGISTRAVTLSDALNCSSRMR